MNSSPRQSCVGRWVGPAAAAIALAHAGSAHASGVIYQSTTSTGLPVYSSDPALPGGRPYLTIARPVRPAEPGPLAANARARLPAGTAGQRMSAERIDALVSSAARSHGVPKALLLAVMHAESSFDPRAVSPVGAVGLMQIMPPTGRRYGVDSGLEDPVNNIDVGARYLRDLLKLFGGDKALAVAAYNAGEAAVIKHGWRIPPYAETRVYVPRVLSLYGQYAATAR